MTTPMSTTSSKAWALGVAILSVAHIMVFISVQVEAESLLFDLLSWCSPAIAAFISACLAPRDKILLGGSMALPDAALVVVTNYLYQAQGFAVDFPGLWGGFTLLRATLIWDLIFCTAAAVAGSFLTRKRA